MHEQFDCCWWDGTREDGGRSFLSVKTPDEIVSGAGGVLWLQAETEPAPDDLTGEPEGVNICLNATSLQRLRDVIDRCLTDGPPRRE